MEFHRTSSPILIIPGHSPPIPDELSKAQPYAIASARARTELAHIPVRRGRPRRSGCSISMIAGPRNQNIRVYVGITEEVVGQDADISFAETAVWPSRPALAGSA